MRKILEIIYNAVSSATWLTENKFYQRRDATSSCSIDPTLHVENEKTVSRDNNAKFSARTECRESGSKASPISFSRCSCMVGLIKPAYPEYKTWRIQARSSRARCLISKRANVSFGRTYVCTYMHRVQLTLLFQLKSYHSLELLLVIKPGELTDRRISYGIFSFSHIRKEWYVIKVANTYTRRYIYKRSESSCNII